MALLRGMGIRRGEEERNDRCGRYVVLLTWMIDSPVAIFVETQFG